MEKKFAQEQHQTAAEQGAHPAGPCAMVIFGAAGDLTKRKLLPALYNLAVSGLLPKNFAVVGVTRRDMNHDQFREFMAAEVREFLTGDQAEELLKWFTERMYHAQGDLREPATYEKLKTLLAEIDKTHATGGNYLYYLSTPPSYFCDITNLLAQSGLAAQTNGSWRRIIIEKPFGHDLESAKALNTSLQKVLREEQIYRIDHYLGKETVQNILVLRFANRIFEPIWNQRYIDHVQITVNEELGVEHRGPYYEEAGALRDMVSNHLFQLLTYIAMEPPNSFEAESVRNEKAKVMQAIKPIAPEEVLSWTVRGQYGEGRTADGKIMPAYRNEPKVAPDSKTDTYVAMKLLIDNWRWAGVPFYMRTGKRMASRTTEIAIRFKQPPFMLFRKTPVEHLNSNVLVLRIQPNEGISLNFSAKIPGSILRLGNMKMDFCYQDYFGKSAATGYETLLYDCMNGEATLFQRSDIVEYAWSVLSPILDVWKAMPTRNFPNYVAGSWGPVEADQLLERDGRHWRNHP